MTTHQLTDDQFSQSSNFSLAGNILNAFLGRHERNAIRNRYSSFVIGAAVFWETVQSNSRVISPIKIAIVKIVLCQTGKKNKKTQKIVIVWMDFRKKYLRHCDINQYLESLQTKYSKLVTVTTIGHSYENRPIKSIRISKEFANDSELLRTARSAGALLSNGQRKSVLSQRLSACRSKSTASTKAIILIDAGIHAREWCSISTALVCISQLTENSTQNKILLKKFDFVIVPVLNVDGYEYSRTIVSMK